MLDFYLDKDQSEHVDRIPYIFPEGYANVDSFVAISGLTTDDDYGIVVIEPHDVYMYASHLYTNLLLNTTFTHLHENLIPEVWEYVSDMKYPLLLFKQLHQGTRYNLLFDILWELYYPYPKGKNVLIAYLLALIKQCADLDGPVSYDVNRDEYGYLSSVSFYSDLFEQLMPITLYASLT